MGQISYSFATQDSDGISQEEIDQAVHENQTRIDSLIVLLMNDDLSPEKVGVYVQLSNEYVQLDHYRALQYAKEGLALAVKIGDEEGMLDCHLAIAHINLAFTLELHAALESYESALELARELDKPEDELTIFRGIANVYSQLGNLDAAKDYMKQALEMAEETKDQYQISSINAYLGSMYEDEGDTATALIHYKAVFDIEQKTKFANTSNPSLLTIAHYYYLSGDMTSAIRFYRIALKRFQRELDNRWLSYTHSQLARLYLSDGNFEKAEAHAINGLTIAEQFHLNKEITDNYHILIDISDSMGKPDLAKRYRKAYDDKMAEIREDAEKLNAKVNTVAADDPEEPVRVKEQPPMNRFLQAIMVSLPVLLFLLIMAMPSRRKPQ